MRDKADEESIGAAVSFKVNDGMTITVILQKLMMVRLLKATQTQVLKLRTHSFWFNCLLKRRRL